MMSTSFWSLLIGYISAIAYTLMVVYLVTGLVGVHDIGNRKPSKVHTNIDPDLIDLSTQKELVKFSRKQIAGFSIKLIDGIVMMTVSILLIVGVKKENHKFMAPWLILIFVSALIEIITVILSKQSKSSIILGVLMGVLDIALWYPIFRQYRKLKKSPSSSVEYPSLKCMINSPTAPLYDHINNYPSAAEIEIGILEVPITPSEEM